MKQKYTGNTFTRLAGAISNGYRVAKKQYDLEKEKEKKERQLEIDKIRAEQKKETAAHLNRQKKLHSSQRYQMVQNDRRSEPRYTLKSECEIIHQRQMYNATINDISNSGASITFQTSVLPYNIYTVGSEIDFVFQKKNYPICDIIGIVRNVTTINDTIRIGLQITGGRVDVWKAIVATLEL